MSSNFALMSNLVIQKGYQGESLGPVISTPLPDQPLLVPEPWHGLVFSYQKKWHEEFLPESQGLHLPALGLRQGEWFDGPILWRSGNEIFEWLPLGAFGQFPLCLEALLPYQKPTLAQEVESLCLAFQTAFGGSGVLAFDKECEATALAWLLASLTGRSLAVESFGPAWKRYAQHLGLKIARSETGGRRITKLPSFLKKSKEILQHYQNRSSLLPRQLAKVLGLS